jgi:hypothetical protein
MAGIFQTAKRKARKATSWGADNTRILASLAAGVAAYATVVTVVDTGVGMASPSNYRGFANTLYEDDAGLIISSVALYYSMTKVNKFVTRKGYLKSRSAAKAETAAAAFVFARTLYGLNVYDIGERMKYASAGSMPAALDPDGPAALALAVRP